MGFFSKEPVKTVHEDDISMVNLFMKLNTYGKSFEEFLKDKNDD